MSYQRCAFWRGSLLACGFCLLLASVALAAEPADSAIKGALYDIDRAEQQMPGLSASRGAAIKRVARQLDMAAERLQSSPNQDHPSWQEASERLAALKSQLQSIAAGGTPATPAPATTTQQATTPQQGTGGQQTTTQQATGGQAAPQEPQQAQMNSHDISQFNRASRDLQSVASSMQTLDWRVLHIERERTNWRGRMDRMAQQAERFAPFAHVPEVAAFQQQVAEMTAHYDQQEAAQLEALAALGDIPTHLAEINARYSRDRLPQPLDEPFPAEEVAAWGNNIQELIRTANPDAAWLRMVQSTTPLYDREVRNTLNGTINSSLQGSIEIAVGQTRERLYQPARNIQEWLKTTLEIEPTDTHRLRNTVLNDDTFAQLNDGAAHAARNLRISEIVDRSLGQEPNPQAAQLANWFDEAQIKLAAMRQAALGDQRMPEATSEDAALLQAAADVLGADVEGFNARRMVINHGPLYGQKESRAWWSGDVVTIVDLDWDEFQLTSAEEEDGGFYVYYNTFYFYRQAGSGTATGKWILGKRFRGAPIAEENIDQ